VVTGVVVVVTRVVLVSIGVVVVSTGTVVAVGVVVVVVLILVVGADVVVDTNDRPNRSNTCNFPLVIGILYSLLVCNTTPLY
jgi:hypothetical protein